MRSGKRYTSQTFTKRVDHEGGEHRPVKKRARTVCADCGAQSLMGRWSLHDQRVEPLRGQEKTTICPACLQKRSNIVGGYLTISGAFCRNHRSEIDRLLANEAESALEDNPLSRIIRTAEDDGEILIETTTEHLVQRLGHSLKKAYSGNVVYHFSHKNKVARVKWYRD